MSVTSHGVSADRITTRLRRWRAEVVVTPKVGVNDPEGETIQGGLKSLGFDVEEVRAGRFIRLLVEAPDAMSAERSVMSMCEQLLVNPVIQTYALTVVEVEESGMEGGGAT